MPEYLMLDAASTYNVINAAATSNAKVVAGYVWNPDFPPLQYGWTVDFVNQVRQAGLEFHPIFTFAVWAGLPSYVQCLQILQQYGVQAGEWVHYDIEADAVPSVDWITGLSHYLRDNGYHCAPYGTPGTLGQGFLAYADGPWVATWPGGYGWGNPPLLVNMPNVGNWDWAGWQFAGSTSLAGAEVDLSVANYPVTAVVPPSPGPTPQPPPPPVVAGGNNDNEGDEGSVATLQRPGQDQRYDEVFVGTDFKVWHLWSNVTAQGDFLDAMNGESEETWGGPPNGCMPGTLSARWTNDAQAIIVAVADKGTGQLFKKLISISGAVLFDWFPVKQGFVAPVVGQPGPQGPAGAEGPVGPPGATGSPGTPATTADVHTAIKAALQAAEASL